MKVKANLIIPQPNPGGADGVDQLQAEYAEHLRRAQDLYEQALEAHVNGDSKRDLLFRQAMIEQNAAILCQGEINRAGLSLVVNMLCAMLGIKPEATAKKAAGGVLQ